MSPALEHTRAAFSTFRAGNRGLCYFAWMSTAARGQGESPAEVLRPLRRVRQIREFTDQPVTGEELAAIADVARWSGSSSNEQPWRFVVIRDVEQLRRLAELGHPQTRSLRTAPAAIAITLPDEREPVLSRAYD